MFSRNIFLNNEAKSNKSISPCQPFCCKMFLTFSFKTIFNWGSWIWTNECGSQSPMPYQLGYTPVFRPLLNYQLLAFLGLASIHTLSQWDSNPSLRLSQPVCNSVHHLPKAKLPPFQSSNWFQEPIIDKIKSSKPSLLCQGQFWKFFVNWILLETSKIIIN